MRKPGEGATATMIIAKQDGAFAVWSYLHQAANGRTATPHRVSFISSPVYATGRPPMTELGGDAAVYFDPADTSAAAEIVYEAPPDREKIVRAGIANVKQFSVDNMIDGYMQAYEHVAAKNKAK